MQLTTVNSASFPNVQTTIRPFKTTRHFPSSGRSGEQKSSHLGWAVSLGVLGTIVVCLVFLVAYVWQCSRATNVKSHDEETPIDECSEPSTSSQEPSPVPKRSQR